MLTRNRERDLRVTVRKERNTTWFGSGLHNSRWGMPFSIWVQDVQIREAGRTPVNLKGRLSAASVQFPNLSETFPVAPIKEDIQETASRGSGPWL